jgi:hypothetical protein
MATSTTPLPPVTVTLSTSCLNSIKNGIVQTSGASTGTLTVPLPCAEELWNALLNALKGPSGKKKKGGESKKAGPVKKRGGSGGSGRARANE